MKILVVVDMQNDFIDGALGSAEAQAIVPNVVEKIKNFDGAIAVTFDSHNHDYLETQEGKNLPVEHCLFEEHGWLLNAGVQQALNWRATNGTQVETFFKPTFGSIELGDWISNLNIRPGVDEVVFVGLCTDICVISNAMLTKAFVPEVKITVDASCCAGVTTESHENALKAMKMCQVNIMNWGDEQ